VKNDFVRGWEVMSSGPGKLREKKLVFFAAQRDHVNVMSTTAWC